MTPHFRPDSCTCDPGPEGQHRDWCDLMYGDAEDPRNRPGASAGGES